MMSLAGSGVVVELDLPAPFAVVVGMPPGLEDAGLPAWQDDQPPQVLQGGPAVLQHDGVVLADQIAHRAGLAPFQPLAVGDQLAILVADGDLGSGWGGMDQQPVPGRLVVDPAAGKGNPGRARVGKPQIPDLQHRGFSSSWSLAASGVAGTAFPARLGCSRPVRRPARLAGSGAGRWPGS